MAVMFESIYVNSESFT